MTEEQQAERPESAVLEELQALGEQLATAVTSLWESEESRKLRQEIGEGFVELGQQIDSAVKSAQDSEAAKEFRAQVKDTVEKARETDVAGKLEQGLLTGLRELNTQLSKWVGSMEEKDATPEAPESKPEAQP